MRQKAYTFKYKEGTLYTERDEFFVGPNDLEDMLWTLAMWFDGYYSDSVKERYKGALEFIIVPLCLDLNNETPYIEGWMTDSENAPAGYDRQVFKDKLFEGLLNNRKFIQTKWLVDTEREEIPVTCELLKKYKIDLGDD